MEKKIDGRELWLDITYLARTTISNGFLLLAYMTFPKDRRAPLSLRKAWVALINEIGEDAERMKRKADG